jgi:hypothetical protein
MQDFWPSCGFNLLRCNADGWLVPTDDYLRLFLARPELALVPESCDGERRLHGVLHQSPGREVAPTELRAIADPDARENYQLFLGFRDALLQAGTLEAYYLALQRAGNISIPPLFIDLMVQAILRNVLRASDDAFELRAAEMLFRAQRVAVSDGQVLAGDRDVVDLLNETAGLGDIGRLLVQANAPVHSVSLEVLDSGNTARYLAADKKFNFLLDLTHGLTQDLGHGLQFKLTRAHSGLKALASVLERWIAHFLGVAVSIRPEQQIDDPAWSWHIGLDAQATALLNDLYRDQPVEPRRLQQLISLFRLEFKQPQQMRAELRGKPVYLGLCMTADNTIRLKPQNLLLNLPLAAEH